MQFFLRGMNLKQQLSEYIAVSSYHMLAVGLLGMIGHPLYWLWRTYMYPQSGESLLMRTIGMLVCALLLLYQYWPVVLKRFLPIYYFLTVAYTLPFFFTYYLLSSHYSIILVVAEVAMVFLSMLMLPSLMACALNFALGAGCAIFCVRFFAPQNIYMSAPLFFYVYLPVFVLAVFLGILLRHSNSASVARQIKDKLLQVVPGLIAHDMRHFFGKIKFSFDRIERRLPVLSEVSQPEARSSQQQKEPYQYVTTGSTIISSGVKTVPTILDAVKPKSIDTAHFIYLQAAQTTQKAINEYSYENIDERYKIYTEIKNDFIFKGDEALYFVVLFNLIKNALRGFKLKPSATLVITIDQPTITIRDTGPGIPVSQLAKLFVESHTKDTQNDNELAYCKRVMQAFDGDVTCRSTMGEFTEFILHFPEVAKSTWAAYEQGFLAQVRPYFRDKRILVVDDDDALRMMTQSILGNLGAHSDEAEQGQMALWQLTQAVYDVIVMDLNMPVLDGYAAAEKIRAGAVPGYEQIPIIAYTTDGAYVAQTKTKKVGINYFINKSCTYLTLIQAVAQALKESAAMGKNDKPVQKKEPASDLTKAGNVVSDRNRQPLLTENERSLFDLQRLAICKERGLFKQGENSAYCRQSKEWLVILETSIMQQDFQKMKDALHFLKGSSANIGAQTLSEFVAKIDKQATEGNWPHEEKWFEKIKNIHMQTLAALLLYCL